MIQIGNEKTDYGNWVPAAMMKLCYVVSVVLGLIELVCVIFKVNGIVLILLGILFIVVLAFTLYMQKCHDIFDFKKGGFMGKMHQNLIDQMKWDGKGKLLDIGCGAGALTIRCAKKYKDATLVGIDYWGAEWSYAKEQCEKNAKAEGVGERIAFQDMFEQKALYGDMNEFVELLKKEGITEVHYIGNVDKTDLVPKFVTAPWMIKGVGIIYGIK